MKKGKKNQEEIFSDEEFPIIDNGGIEAYRKLR